MDFINTFKDTHPDISDDRARELKADIIFQMSLIPETKGLKGRKSTFPESNNIKFLITFYIILKEK